MNVSRTVSNAQIGLSVLYSIGYFVMLYLFMSGKIRTPVEWRDQMSVLLGALTTGQGLILNFWFMRARETGKTE